MQEPEAQTGVFQRASNLVDAAVSGRTVRPHHVHLPDQRGLHQSDDFSSADRGESGQCLEDLPAGKAEFGGEPRRPDPGAKDEDLSKANRE